MRSIRVELYLVNEECGDVVVLVLLLCLDLLNLPAIVLWC